jgi:hypothetical protein
MVAITIDPRMTFCLFGRAVHAGHSSARWHTTDGGVTLGSSDHPLMGFNPFRARRRRASDYVFVAAAFALTAALLVWALLPR